MIGWVVKFGILLVDIFNFCDFIYDCYWIVDDCFYGGGSGMLMMVKLFIDVI